MALDAPAPDSAGDKLIEVAVEGSGLPDIELVEVVVGAPKSSLIAAIADKIGAVPAELMLFEEDVDEPVDILALIEDRHAQVTHHVHRAREIEVTVYYLDKSAKQVFPPSARVQRVLDWAVAVPTFQIDPAIAPEMELAIHGQTSELPKRAHIGRYAEARDHRLELDLIRGVIPNGSAW